LAENKPEVLERKVGLLETVAMITGLVIGAGIFGMVPTIAGMAGPAVFVAFIVACLPSLS
jgi:amino acid transporter